MTPAPAGPVLALDASTATGSVAVGTAGEVLAEVALKVNAGHSSALLPAIDASMRRAGVAPADLSGVVVGGGPGSFTGLRVAAATAKGVAHARGIPLFAYSGLLAAAAGCWNPDRPVCALFDARRGDVFAACYGFGNREPGIGNREQETGNRGAVRTMIAPAAMSIDALIERLRGLGPVLFTGDGAMVHGDRLRTVEGAAIVPPHLRSVRAASLLWLAGIAPKLGRVDDSGGWQPSYLRASGAERIRAAAAGNAG